MYVSLGNVSFTLYKWDGDFITELGRLDQYLVILLVQFYLYTWLWNRASFGVWHQSPERYLVCGTGKSRQAAHGTILVNMLRSCFNRPAAESTILK